MSEVMIEIQELYSNGYTVTQIFNMTGYPMDWIESVISQFEFDDSF